MFRVRYLLAELRRRRGRTILTALGLGVGVGLVVAVSALSKGLDDAQQQVLEPLTGVGTDMSVNRPISFDNSDNGGPPQISESERKKLQKETGGGMLDFSKLGNPGDKFSTDRFMSSSISFDSSQVKKVSKLNDVEAVAPSLTVNVIHIEGTIPDSSSTSTDAGPTGGPPPGGGPPGAGGGFGVAPLSVTGIRPADSNLGTVTADQVTKGRFLRENGKHEAMVSSDYAAANDISVGDTVKVGDQKLDVVGIVKAPIGSEASDIYMDLGELQKVGDFGGRVNGLEVRASDVNTVNTVSSEITSAFKGAQVTTASELADSVSGSLVDAKNLSGSLGTALSIVSLLGAFAIAGLLTLSAVNKRTRELGTLKAIGWRRSRVIGQITGESVAQGLLGGIVGALIGIGAAALIGSLGISLDATAQAATSAVGAPGGLGPPGGGGAAADAASTTVQLGAPVDVGLILAAIALAVIGGLVAGAIGGARAARLRPAEALRSVE